LTVRYRGDRDEEDPKRSIIFEGALDASGTRRLEVEPAYYVVLAKAFQTVPAPMHEKPGPMTIELR
jgi:hypothetical protein